MNIIPLTAISLHVYWIAPELDIQDGDVIEYIISCSSSFGFNHIGVVPAGTTGYTLSSLRPFSNYTCCISANTTNGLSSSLCAIQQTLQDSKDICLVSMQIFTAMNNCVYNLPTAVCTYGVTNFYIMIAGPYDVPQNITVETGSASALYIEWNHPLIPNGIITYYTIFATFENGSEAIHSVNGSTRSYILEGLSPHQLVFITMSAGTVAGEGPHSDEMAYRTSMAGIIMFKMIKSNPSLICAFVYIVPSAVRNVEVHPLSPYLFLISWVLPKFPNGILTGYEITAYNKLFGYNSTASVSPDVANVNISENIGESD